MNSIDQNTVAQIFKLKPKGVNGIQVFIVGGISYAVEQYLMAYGLKTFRISGSNIYETSVKIGHAFTFTSILSPFDSVSGSLFAHLGKHTPILVVSRDSLPDVTRNYIESVKPEPKRLILHLCMGG